MGVLDAIRDEQFRVDVGRGLLDALQSASNAAANNVTGPVDMAAWLLRAAGIPVGARPFGGSAWAKQNGLIRDVPANAANALAEGLGGAAPIYASAKAPQIAASINQGLANLQAPKYLNPESGAMMWNGIPRGLDAQNAGAAAAIQSPAVFGGN